MNQKLLLSLLSLLFSISLAIAGDTKFTSESTGYDWNRATTEYKQEYAKLMAGREKELAPGITGTVIYDSLNTFYTSSDPNILSQPIVQMVALTVAAFAKSE